MRTGSVNRFLAIASVLTAWAANNLLLFAFAWGRGWWFGFLGAMLVYASLYIALLPGRIWLYNWGRLGWLVQPITFLGAGVTFAVMHVVWNEPLFAYSSFQLLVLPAGVAAMIWAGFFASRILEGIPILVPARK